MNDRTVQVLFQFCACNAIWAEGLSFLGDSKIDSMEEIFTTKKKSLNGMKALDKKWEILKRWKKGNKRKIELKERKERKRQQ